MLVRVAEIGLDRQPETGLLEIMKAQQPTEPELMAVYELLLSRNGHQHWWPGETLDEIVTGAILTQHVAWRNVEQALRNLAEQGIRNLRDIHQTPAEKLAPLLRPTLYYNQKCKRLKAFARWFTLTYATDFQRMFASDPGQLREQMLSLKGLGPETVDSILLYAGFLPVFVIDAYTGRLLSRLGCSPHKDNYAGWQQYIISRLPLEVGLYQDFHAQIVAQCKAFCRPLPLCANCPLQEICVEGKSRICP